MKCTVCHGCYPSDAVFCPDCGNRLYWIEWSDECSYVSDGSAEVPFEIHVAADETITVERFRIREGETLAEVAQNQGYPGTTVYINKFRIGAVHKIHPSYGPDSPLHNVVCDIKTSRGVELELSADALVFADPPEVEVSIESAHPSVGRQAGPIPVDLKPTDGYALWVSVTLQNSSRTVLSGLSWKGFDGHVEPTARLFNSRDRTTEAVEQSVRISNHSDVVYAIRIPPPMKEGERPPLISEPTTLSLGLHFTGVENPIERQIEVTYLNVRQVQVLVQRPTAAGFAFLGRHAIAPHDFSRERLETRPGLTALSDEIKRRLAQDTLVETTLRDIAHSRITWSVPKGQPRTRCIAIDRCPEDDTKFVFDRLRYSARFELEGRVTELGEFIGRQDDDTRWECELTLPALDADATGYLTVTYGYPEQELRETYEVTVKVFESEEYIVPIGVDFGTINSCVALSVPERLPGGKLGVPAVGGGSVELLPVGDLEDDLDKVVVIPTAVAIEADGTLNARSVSGEIATAFKPWLGKDPGKQNLPAPPHALAVCYLSYLLDRVRCFFEERGLETSVFTMITASTPTAFSEAQRNAVVEAYREAAIRADMTIKEDGFYILDESMAAFLYESMSTLGTLDTRTPALVMVYDFGGGTTDVTVALMRWNEARGAQSFLEVAAGGSGRLGGTNVTSRLATELFGEPPDREAFDIAEDIKVRSSADPQEFVGPVKTRLGRNLTDGSNATGEEIKARIAGAKARMMAWLMTEVDRIVGDVLGKVCARTRDFNESLPLTVLLAGNSSRLEGFERRLEGVVRAWIENHAPSHAQIEINDVRAVDKPKACVALGAFQSDGSLPGVDAPYRPHVSFWLMLPMVANPDSTVHVVCKVDGLWCVEIFPEGTEAPMERSLDPKTLGLGGGGTCYVVEKQGVDFQKILRESLKPAPTKGRLIVRMEKHAVTTKFAVRWGSGVSATLRVNSTNEATSSADGAMRRP